MRQPLFVAACTAMLLSACSSSPDAPSASDAPSEYLVPASAASKSELGVAGWRVDFADDAYRVTGLDARKHEQVVMQMKQSEDDGATQTEIGLDTPAGHFVKSFTTSANENELTNYRDEIASDPKAARTLELMGSDVGQESAPAGSDVSTASLHPLEQLITTPPSGSGLVFGNNGSNKECSDNQLVYGGRNTKNGKGSCYTLINNTNSDCMTTAQCGSRKGWDGKKLTSPCGGSDSTCRADQAYVRTLGCDLKCAKAGH